MKYPLKTVFAAAVLSGALAATCNACAAGKTQPVVADAVVEGVQMPAWLDRDGKSQPLMPGQQLKNGDNLRTGANSRVLLKMGEGSMVKLGENGTLKLDNLGKRPDNFFTATLEVAAGAFRFTTDVLSKFRQRDVSVKIATITAGIRGTDLWGKATSDKDVVCLIEGKISVTRGSDAPIAMNDPMSFYIAPKDAAPLPVAPVDAVQLAQWSLETEIGTGTAATRKGGKWKVTLAVADSEDGAFAVYDAARAAGYPAEIYPTGTADKRKYLVRISQLPGKLEAQQLANSLKGRFGVTAPTVSG
jgi:hypothetical protein